MVGHLNNLAYLYMAAGRFAEAEPRFVEALGLADRLAGANSPDRQRRRRCSYQPAIRRKVALRRRSGADDRLGATGPPGGDAGDRLRVAGGRRLGTPHGADCRTAEAILLVVPTRFGTHVMGGEPDRPSNGTRSEWTQERGQMRAVGILLRDIAVTMADEGYAYDRRTAHALYRQLVVPVASSWRASAMSSSPPRGR